MLKEWHNRKVFCKSFFRFVLKGFELDAIPACTFGSLFFAATCFAVFALRPDVFSPLFFDFFEPLFSSFFNVVIVPVSSSPKGSQRERASARKDSSAFGRSTKGFIGLASIESRIKRSRIARGNGADERSAFSSGQLNGFRRLFANFSGRREPSCRICDAINRTVLWLLVDRPIVVVVARSTWKIVPSRAAFYCSVAGGCRSSKSSANNVRTFVANGLFRGQPWPPSLPLPLPPVYSSLSFSGLLALGSRWTNGK